ATFAHWLEVHPGVEIISRDRGGSYAEGARLGAPTAQQTADRWHLLKNLSEALEGIFLHKKALLKEVMHDPTEMTTQEVATVAWHTGVTKHHEEVSLQRHQERIERYHTIHDLSTKKVDAATIARQVGISRQSVYEYLKMDQPPERRSPHRTRKQLLEPYKDYLIKRWNEGCRSAQQMWREIKEQGYVGSDSSVSRFIAKIRSRKGKPRSFQQVEPTPETKVTKMEAEQRRPPTALQVARLMTLTDEQRVDWQKTYLTRLCQADSVIAQTYDLVQDFAIMLRERQGVRLDDWLKRVQEQEGSELRNFAQGIQRDYDAVKTGLTLEWSNGQVEGQVHRLKLLKRQMYGRGSFQVLRKRVLHRA
ncbi:MAG: transposase, partial [Ktedonobacteraceae bacterium]|nr:transposase [Ktedonobacteraceae bacterium]